MRYILVNGRVPRGLPRYCVYCCEAIGEQYLREQGTRLIYCTWQCYESHVYDTLVASGGLDAQRVVAPRKPKALPAPMRLLPGPLPASGDMA